MSLPENTLSSRPIFGAFLVPEKSEDLIDFEWGGNDLLDTSSGLYVQIWSCYYKDGWICIQSKTANYQLIEVENVKSVSLSFDFNMHAVVAYTVETLDKSRSAYLYWYDSAEADHVITEFGTDYITPLVSLDDHRSYQSSNADIIFAYIKDSCLCYRQQRDRFQIEYTLVENLEETHLRQIGMTTKNRFQFAFA